MIRGGILLRQIFYGKERGTMLKNVYLYLCTIPVFLVLDLFWLGFVARDFYRRQLGFLMRPETNWAAASIFYLVFIAGLLTFGVLPAIDKDSLPYAVIYGGLFGFFCYATFDLTGLAVIRDFPLKMALADMLWGIALSSLVSAASFFIGKKFIF
jgi:uncharacterized membrane protein